MRTSRLFTAYWVARTAGRAINQPQRLPVFVLMLAASLTITVLYIAGCAVVAFNWPH